LRSGTRESASQESHSKVIRLQNLLDVQRGLRNGRHTDVGGSVQLLKEMGEHDGKAVGDENRRLEVVNRRDSRESREL
jgi:hypothetical protein